MSRNLIGFGLQLCWLAAACDYGGLDSHRLQVPAKLIFTLQPTSVIAGVAMRPAFAVTVLDERANAVTSARTSITLSLANNPGGARLSGTVTVAAVNGVATFSDLTLDASGTGYTVVAEATGLSRATSYPFKVTFPPAKLAFQVQPSPTAPAQAIGPPVRVAVLDVQGNAVETGAMTVSLAIETNPTGGTLRGNATAVVENGIASFPNLLIDKPGRGYTLSASASGVESVTSDPFTVGGFLVFTMQPTAVIAGAAIRPAVAVTVLDELGNKITSARTSVTLGLADNPGGATLSGTVTAAAVDGVATFRDLSLDRSGTGYSLVAEASDLSGATSSPFKVTYAPAQLAFQVQPSRAALRKAMFPPVQMAVLDVEGNTVESANLRVRLALETNPMGGTLGGDTTAPVVNGLAVFPNLVIDEPYWAYTLSASASGVNSITSNPFAVVSFEASAPSPEAAALRLYEAASVHATLATSPHFYMAFDDRVESWDCAPMSLDGAPPPAVLPTGSHIFSATFDRCYVDLLVGTWLNGTASSAYTTLDLDDLTARVSVSSMRGKLVAFRSDLHDVTADGGGTWTRVRTWTPGRAETTTYRPTPGSTLINNRTGNAATLGGGSYTRGWGPPPPGFAASAHEEFDNLNISVGGATYILNGSLQSVYGFDSRNFHTGEVRVTTDGSLAARIFGDENGTLRTEVLTSLATL